MRPRHAPMRPNTLRLAAMACIVGLMAPSIACGGDDAMTTSPCGAPSAPDALRVEVLDERPHDPSAFTQGLLVVDGALYESTGREGESTIRQVDAVDGGVLRSADLGGDEFGEGLTNIGGDRFVQLTWMNGTAIVWNGPTFERVGEHRYDGEGWGITTLDDGRLVMSDGSDVLTVRDPDDFAVRDRWEVQRSDGPTDQLNELDWDGDHLWANRWQTDEIVRIDPECRQVDGVVDAAELTARATELSAGQPIDVLNGIAHVPGTDRFLLTGKHWPVMFEVRFVAA